MQGSTRSEDHGDQPMIAMKATRRVTIQTGAIASPVSWLDDDPSQAAVVSLEACRRRRSTASPARIGELRKPACLPDSAQQS
jgi:hypothetical protein